MRSLVAQTAGKRFIRRSNAFVNCISSFDDPTKTQPTNNWLATVWRGEKLFSIPSLHYSIRIAALCAAPFVYFIVIIDAFHQLSAIGLEFHWAGWQMRAIGKQWNEANK